MHVEQMMCSVQWIFVMFDQVSGVHPQQDGATLPQ
ncbi:hypothetical protein R69888_02518 [Paraburkholderia haematera]|uniref:Uncharacterized protein n=2 Tax=Paraburkholderia haematera TaxID=2793077 RepID=A0ABM8R9T9_9BURK|nr:hypothetical protein R69888_02518 [Paraburkholderia haematera]